MLTKGTIASPQPAAAGLLAGELPAGPSAHGAPCGRTRRPAVCDRADTPQK